MPWGQVLLKQTGYHAVLTADTGDLPQVTGEVRAVTGRKRGDEQTKPLEQDKPGYRYTGAPEQKKVFARLPDSFVCRIAYYREGDR
ncbi:hypothetical protein DPE14_24535 [Salmonella enterica subsp. enterica]|uniref:Uncharacterized protein n=1 Tax=Salmonella enterica subsp. enterica serovar London TaxID=149390 RepID=A0A5X2FJB9_SALET|nr:hypothetical protein [Salmonella enterica subsp. enterica serovar Bredeney]EAA4401974.1 hypothetical protein [Salmonella enterica subsp. enterica serovar London]EAA7354013.1 hypothetical protein [Salmonella enterica subsp. enterica]EAB7892544.1 hypothetical protein [Salmonella enterica subsp. enterica serovar Newport]EAP2626753.1 hypothetical protein [Salmonella enterica]EBW5413541.1 hypothetical protein [Salmonella enterica subsp. enterica serovar Bonn]EBY7415529.1 hypothetical protein [S